MDFSLVKEAQLGLTKGFLITSPAGQQEKGLPCKVVSFPSGGGEFRRNWTTAWKDS